MSILEIKEYLKLCLDGKDTIPERQESINYINWKKKFYQDILDGNRPYESSLINTKEY